MVSSTHYSEVITVDPGQSQTFICGGCELPGSGSWSMIAKSTGKTYFDNGTTFGPGTYRITYLGSTQFNPKICSDVNGKCSDFAWDTKRIPEPLMSTRKINLSNWTEMDYVISTSISSTIKGNHPGKGIWTITDTIAKQSENASPTFLVSDFTLVNQTFSVQITVGNQIKYPIDNDFFGVAWALSSSNNRPDNYYLIYWKRTSTDQGHAGLSLFRMVNLAKQEGRTMFDKIWLGDDWTSGTSQIKVLARKEGPYWDFNKAYSFNIKHLETGESKVDVTESATGKSVWSVSFTDPDPLPSGKVAFFDLSQENVNYIYSQSSITTFLNESPPGSVCTTNKSIIKFNGSSDDIAILIHQDDTVTQDHTGVTDDPVIITIPNNHFIFNDTSGHVIGNSVEKTFETEDISYTFEESLTSDTVNEGHVSDMIPDGFNVINWGDPISVETLARLKWIDSDGTFRFKFFFVPSGIGFVQVTGVTCVEGSSPVNPSTYSWNTIKNINNVITTIDDAPTAVNTSSDFVLSSSAQLGVDLVQTPAGLDNPQFRLQLMSITINNPKSIIYEQVNDTGRYHNYRYIITIGSHTYDTSDSDDWKYFQWSSGYWVGTTQSLAPFTSSVINFNLPFDTDEITAQLSVIVDGDESSPIVADVDIIPRTIEQTILAFHRDLVVPDELTAKKAIYRIGKDAALYNIYMYSNGELSPLSSDVIVANRQTIVGVNKSLTSLDHVLYQLNNRTGILKNRYVED